MAGKTHEQKFIRMLEDARQAAVSLSAAAAERQRILTARLHDAQQIALSMVRTAAERERSLADKLHDAQENALLLTQAATEREQILSAKLHETQQVAAECERGLISRINDLQIQLTESRSAIEYEQKLIESLLVHVARQAKLVTSRLRDLKDSFEQIATMRQAPPILTSRNESYNIADLDALQGEQFVRAAYQVLLRREPDASGFEYYRRRLGRGITKIQILGEIRYSEEGRAAGVKIPGLALQYALRKTANAPVIGVIVRIYFAISYLLQIERFRVASEDRLVQLSEQNERLVLVYLDAVCCAIDDIQILQSETIPDTAAFNDRIRKSSQRHLDK